MVGARFNQQPPTDRLVQQARALGGLLCGHVVLRRCWLRNDAMQASWPAAAALDVWPAHGNVPAALELAVADAWTAGISLTAV